MKHARGRMEVRGVRSVWEIVYNNGVATLKDLPENALPGDSK